jgi:hypothetical protein
VQLTSAPRQPGPAPRCGTARRGRIKFGSALAVTLVIAATSWQPSITPASSRAQEPPPTVKPAQIVILVDESGSISDADIERERDAASLIAQAEFSPSSTISVIGFASANDTGQSAVDAVCPPITVSTAQDQQALADCVRKLRKRAKTEGNGTDHAAALNQALPNLIGPGRPDGPRMIFLLTDGKLDVSDSPQYGLNNDGDQRNKAALNEVDKTLAAARQANITVWPLGFGDVDRQQLDRFAAGGSQGSCGPNSPKPSATVVAGSSDVLAALHKAFQLGRCAGGGEIQRRDLLPGQTVDATVTIPTIATDGSIVVVKHDPRIAVSFIDPTGATVPKSGEVNGSTFQGSGANGGVEALRVVNPVAGAWTVRLVSFPDVPPVEINAVVTWQGAVRGVLVTRPSSPRAGENVVVELSLHTRNRAITDPTELRQLTFTAGLAGDGFAGMTIGLNDDGRDADSAANNGVYSGVVKVPDTAKGALRFDGSVTGIGISGDTRVLNTQVAPSRRSADAVIDIETSGRTFAPGESVSGNVTITNNLGVADKARMLIVDAAPGTIASIPGQDTLFDLPAAGTRTFPFQVTFGQDTVRGANTLTLRVEDADSKAEISSRQLTMTVEVPPRPFPWAVVLIVLTVIVAAGVLWLWLNNRRKRRDIRGLVIYLHERGRPRGDLAAPEQLPSIWPWSAPVFKFTLHTFDHAPPQIDHAADAEDCYQLTRLDTTLRVRSPFGEVFAPNLLERVDISQDISIEVHDELPDARADHDDHPSGATLDGDQHLI